MNTQNETHEVLTTFLMDAADEATPKDLATKMRESDSFFKITVALVTAYVASGRLVIPNFPDARHESVARDLLLDFIGEHIGADE